MKARSVKLWLFAIVFFAATLSWPKDGRAQFPLLGGNLSNMWNVTISGFTTGIGNIQFIDDPTYGKIVAGYIFIKPKALQNKNAPSPFHVGSFLLIGTWTVSGSGVVTGVMSGGSQDVPLDISFTAKGTDLVSISITGTSTNGPVHMKGVPVLNVFVPDLTGPWTATTVKNGISSVEIFDLTPSADLCIVVDDVDPDPNVEDIQCVRTIPAINMYDLVSGTNPINPYGIGPGYVLPGSVLGSSGGQIAVVVAELLVNKDDGTIADTGTVRTVAGKLNSKKSPFKASMSGSDDNQANVKMDMTH